MLRHDYNTKEEEKLHEKLGFVGNQRRKGSVMKKKRVVSGGRKKISRGRKNVILKSFAFEEG